MFFSHGLLGRVSAYSMPLFRLQARPTMAHDEIHAIGSKEAIVEYGASIYCDLHDC